MGELEVTTLLRGDGERLGELVHAEHAVERGAQLVAHVGEEHRLGLVGTLGREALRVGQLQGPLQTLRALADALLEHRLMRLQRIGRDHLVVDVEERPDQHRGKAVAVRPDPGTRAEPAPAAVLRAEARLVLDVHQVPLRAGVRLDHPRQIVGVDALANRFLRVRELGVLEAEHLLVAG